MMVKHALAALICATALPITAQAQVEFQDQLCEAAKTGGVIEMVYDKDASKGCKPRIIDVHQVAIGNNGSLYLHGWQRRGCTKGRDFEAKRIFKFEKIKAVDLIEGGFGVKSQAAKDEGWDGCIGSNWFIKEMICE